MNKSKFEEYKKCWLSEDKFLSVKEMAQVCEFVFKNEISIDSSDEFITEGMTVENLREAIGNLKNALDILKNAAKYSTDTLCEYLTIKNILDKFEKQEEKMRND